MELKRIHPLVAVASVAVILFSGLGAAALMGWLPSSTGKAGDDVAIAKSDMAPAMTGKAAIMTTPVTGPAQSATATSTPRQNVPIAAKSRPVQVASSATVAKAICASCGVVQSVREVEKAGEGTGIGAVGGAVVGGVVGNQFGGGSGKKILTVAGAVGGGVAGHQIEKKVRATKSYEISVRFENGTTQVFSEANPPSWKSGDKVKLIDGKLQPNNA
jgi:outer membrane lipoprotein SlyB